MLKKAWATKVHCNALSTLIYPLSDKKVVAPIAECRKSITIVKSSCSDCMTFPIDQGSHRTHSGRLD